MSVSLRWSVGDVALWRPQPALTPAPEAITWPANDSVYETSCRIPFLVRCSAQRALSGILYKLTVLYQREPMKDWLAITSMSLF